MSDDKSDQIRQRLLEDPELTVVPDRAIAGVAADNFDLPFRIGPVYDVIRHPGTITPLAVGVYGDWGAGKTSAMRWLDQRLQDWTAHKTPKKGRKQKISLRTVWFYPWKYQSREDVWRGLVAEVIIACLRRAPGSAKEVLAEAKDLARFLGKSAWSVVSCLKLTAGAGAKATFDFKELDKIAEHARDYVHPEAAYLNEFEETLKSWVAKSLGGKGEERLVVFIDDLDRCMPEVALQVLEALKLYLNIENLVFVVGVDDRVVTDLVIKHYRELGVDEEKARQYLAKMFQMEVPLTPSDVQIKDFLESILEANPTWQEIEENAQTVFGGVIGTLAERSPREVKRLVNSALMRGAGARMSALAHDEGKTPPTAEQGMQVFLVRWILDRRHRRGGLVAQDIGTRFFCAWSEIVRAHPDADPCLALSDEMLDVFGGGRDSRPGRLPPPPGGRAPDRPDPETLKTDIPERFHPLLDETAFQPYLFLLANRELGRLMAIEYPEEAAAISGGDENATDQEIVDRAIADHLGKQVKDLTDEDRRGITELDLPGSGLKSLEHLKAFTGLQILNLSNTDISDLTPLKALSGIQALGLSNTGVSDVEPLEALTLITHLNLSETPVSTLPSFKALADLRVLDLSGTRVRDLAPLRDLIHLKWLDLSDTPVSDVEPLKRLKNLETLNLKGTNVSADAVEELQAALPNIKRFDA